MFKLDMIMHHRGEKKEGVHNFAYKLMFVYVNSKKISIQDLIIRYELEILFCLMHNNKITM